MKVLGKTLTFNTSIFSRELVLSEVKTKLDEGFERFSADDITYLIEHDKDFAAYITGPALVAVKAEVRQYGWVAPLLTDDRLAALLPPHIAGPVMARGEQGQVWLKRQLAWLRGLLKG